MVKTASSLKRSRGISSSLGRLGVGMTMPKSVALPSKPWLHGEGFYLFDFVVGDEGFLAEAG